MDSGNWWWTGRPGVLQFMGSQRVGHDWATELNWKAACGAVRPLSRAVLSKAPRDNLCQALLSAFGVASRPVLLSSADTPLEPLPGPSQGVSPVCLSCSWEDTSHAGLRAHFAPCNLSLTTCICKGPISTWGHMHRHQESGKYTRLGTQFSLHQWPAKHIKPVFFWKPSSNSSMLHPCFPHCLWIKSLKRQRERLTLKVKESLPLGEWAGCRIKVVLMPCFLLILLTSKLYLYVFLYG